MKRTREPSHVASSESGDFHRRKLRMVETDEDDNNSLEAPPVQRKHFCEICRKQFNSGKAYGGHVRIHSSEYRNKGKMKMKTKKKAKAKRSVLVKREKKKKGTDLTRADVAGKIRCWVCGKEFGTRPSLFGHMWRHPKRSWKGIQPPPPYDDNDDDDDDDAYYDYIIRSMMMSDATEDVQRAAFCLMMLSYSGDKKKKKMEVEVKLNPQQVEPKRSLGFDLNQPYHHADH